MSWRRPAPDRPGVDRVSPLVSGVSPSSARDGRGHVRGGAGALRREWRMAALRVIVFPPSSPGGRKSSRRRFGECARTGACLNRSRLRK